MDGVKTGGFFAIGPFGDPGGGINDGGIGEATGFVNVHSSTPLAPSLAAKKSAVSDDAMNAGFELPPPGLISAANSVPGLSAVLFHNSTPLLPLLAEK